MPPAASTVWASLRGRVPITTASEPASCEAIATRNPAAPEPMTSALDTFVLVRVEPSLMPESSD